VVWLVEVVLGSTIVVAGGGDVTTTGGGCCTTILGASGTYVVVSLTSRLAHPTVSAAAKNAVAVTVTGISFIMISFSTCWFTNLC
jgi:hypothetical protein